MACPKVKNIKKHDSSNCDNKIEFFSDNINDTSINTHRPARMKKRPDYLKDYQCNSNTSTPWCNLIQFHALSSTHKKIVKTHDKYVEPKSYHEATQNPKWVEAMKKELKALSHNHTWDIVSLPLEKKLLATSGFIK